MLEIFQYNFMQNALIVWLIIAIIWPIMWSFLIIRRYSMITDTLSHTSLTWIILWLWTWYSPLLTTLFYSIFSAIVIEKLRLTKKMEWDMVLAIFLTFNLAIVATAISLNTKFMLNISSYFFWSIALVSRKEVYIVIFIAFIILTTMFLIKKSLLKTTYDEDNAQASGVNTKIINLIFIILVSMLITLSIPITWILLLSSLIILPVIISSQISWSFKSTLIIAEIISIISVLSWIIFSYYYDLSASWAISFILLWFFVSSLIYWKIFKKS